MSMETSESHDCDPSCRVIFLHKRLSQSDLSISVLLSGRVVLSRAQMEANAQSIIDVGCRGFKAINREAGSARYDLTVVDSKGITWNLLLKQWTANSARTPKPIYVLEKTAECMKSNRAHPGYYLQLWIDPVNDPDTLRLSILTPAQAAPFQAHIVDVPSAACAGRARDTYHTPSSHMINDQYHRTISPNVVLNSPCSRRPGCTKFLGHPGFCSGEKSSPDHYHDQPHSPYPNRRNAIITPDNGTKQIEQQQQRDLMVVVGPRRGARHGETEDRDNVKRKKYNLSIASLSVSPRLSHGASSSYTCDDDDDEEDADEDDNVGNLMECDVEAGYALLSMMHSSIGAPASTAKTSGPIIPQTKSTTSSPAGHIHANNRAAALPLHMPTPTLVDDTSAAAIYSRVYEDWKARYSGNVTESRRHWQEDQARTRLAHIAARARLHAAVRRVVESDNESGALLRGILQLVQSRMKLDDGHHDHHQPV